MITELQRQHLAQVARMSQKQRGNIGSMLVELLALGNLIRGITIHTRRDNTYTVAVVVSAESCNLTGLALATIWQELTVTVSFGV